MQRLSINAGLGVTPNAKGAISPTVFLDVGIQSDEKIQPMLEKSFLGFFELWQMRVEQCLWLDLHDSP